MDKKRDKLLNVAQVTDILTCSRRHVYNLIAKGALPAFRLGERSGLRVRESEVDKFLERCVAEELD